MNRKYQSSPKLTGWIHILIHCFRFIVFFLGIKEIAAQPDLHHITDEQPIEHQPNTTKGWMLINELGCFQCHTKPSTTLKGLPTFDAPILNEAHQRLTPAFVHQFIQNPGALDSGTRMPSVMDHLTKDQKTEAAKHLTAFLMQSDLNQDHPLPTKRILEQQDINEGRTLFSVIGCAACHPFQNSGPEKFPASLRHVSTKYQFAGLKQFLRNPKSVRKGFRMPDLNLTEIESKKLAAYLLSPKPISQLTFASDGDAEQGKVLFSQLQCMQCHTIPENEDLNKPKIPLALPASLNRGCLSDTPSGDSPSYGLSSLQLDLIRSALSQAIESNESDYRVGVNAYMRILQCNACHERQPLSPPRMETHAHFTSSGEDLGDEGRIPPSLNGVGRKLTQTALLKTIQGEMPVRPYMNTRMPNWGKNHAAFLAEQFAKADLAPDEKPTPRNGQENQVGRNMWGRALVGIEGLGCIQCHPLNGTRSLGIQAMDLKYSSERLRAPWFRDYLLDPAKFRPGTRMPAVGPDGKPSVGGQGGSTERQIDSIWAYLNELDQSRLPKGMESKDDFKLTPENHPLVFRTFMEDAGLHAIAVGFPQNFHVAFDSKSCRWAIAWSGPFLDAEATWHDRFTPLTKPLGEILPWFPQSNFVWEKPGLTNQNQAILAAFSGYRLDEQGTPLFHYSLDGDLVIDTVQSLQDGIRRSVKLSAESKITHWLIYESESITQKDDQSFLSEQHDGIHVEQGTPFITEKDHLAQLWIQFSPAPKPRLQYTIRRNIP